MGVGGRERSFINGFSHLIQQPSLIQAKGRSPEHPKVLPGGWQGLKHLSRSWCFPGTSVRSWLRHSVAATWTGLQVSKGRLDLLYYSVCPNRESFNGVPGEGETVKAPVRVYSEEGHFIAIILNFLEEA